MGFVRVATIHTPKRGVVARSASNVASGCGASVSPIWVVRCAPSTGGQFGAFAIVVPKGVAVGALGVGDEPQATFGPIP